jgi:competence protein ComFC
LDYKTVKRLVLNFIYQPKCVFCKKVLSVRTYTCVCEDCSGRLPHTRIHVCDRCSAPMDSVYGNPTCQDCRKHKRYFEQNISPFLYEDPIRHIILQMKFYEFLAAADVLGYYMADKLAKSDILQKIDLVTFVPLSDKRYKERGFNQAKLLAVGLLDHLDRRVFLEDILRKPVDNLTQSTLSPQQRLENVKGVYAVREKADIAGKSILLIDDVMTTGATLNECSKQLKKAGAKSVYAATAAVSSYQKY